MIHYLTGDILTTLDKVIVYGCNTKGITYGNLGSAIHRKYSEVYSDYKTREMEFGLCLGDIILSKIKDKIIISAITLSCDSIDGTEYVSYDAMDECFRRITTSCRSFNIDRISIPIFGGGDWNVIEKIIERHAKNDLTITVYKLEDN